MQLTFHLVFERSGDEVIGHCLEVPGAIGRGEKLPECKERLWESVADVLQRRAAEAREEIAGGAIEVEIELQG